MSGRAIQLPRARERQAALCAQRLRGWSNPAIMPPDGTDWALIRLDMAGSMALTDASVNPWSRR